MKQFPLRYIIIRNYLLFSLLLISSAALYSCLSRGFSSGPASVSLMKRSDFDTIINEKKVELFTLCNNRGITVQVTNYGGHIVSVFVPDRNGSYDDVVLGYRSISEYLEHRLYQACIIGPYAYVISKGRFSIDGQEYQLKLNNGVNNLHSFPDGFDRQVFDAKQSKNKVTMSAEIPHMKNGFPGNRKVTVIYELLADNTLKLELKMTTDRKTICNLTNHAYFNLAGEGNDDIQDHIIQIFADSITPYGPGAVPTGKIIPVEGTPFDLRVPVPIRKMINSDHEQIRGGRGYDRNFVLAKKKEEYGMAARLMEPSSGRYLEIYTNQPGIQFYSGNYLNGTVTGKSGKPYKSRCALCLEPMKYPDSPNHPDFPSTLLEPGEEYYNIIDYKFGIYQ